MMKDPVMVNCEVCGLSTAVSPDGKHCTEHAFQEEKKPTKKKRARKPKCPGCKRVTCKCPPKDIGEDLKAAPAHDTTLSDAFAFLKSAIQESDLVPLLSSVLVKQGRISAWNGEMRLSARVPLDIEGTPSGTVFLKAIHALPCINTIIDNGETWEIRGGNSCVNVPIVATMGAVMPDPDGDIAPLNETSGVAFVEACRRLAPLIGKDASRPWAQCLKLEKGMAMVTNNVILIQSWLDFPFPDRALQIPVAAVTELARIKTPPDHVQVGETTVTFHWRKEDRYLMTQVIKTDWPDIEPVFERVDWAADPELPASQFWEALEITQRFTTAPLHSVRWDGQTIEGGEASVDNVGCSKSAPGEFSARQMLLLEKFEDLKLYPTGDVIGFRSELMRGIMQTYRMK